MASIWPHRRRGFLLTVAFAVALLVTGLGSEFASADHCPFSLVEEFWVCPDDSDHDATVSIGFEGLTQASGTADAGPAMAPRVCRFDGREIPCSNAVGYWSNQVEAWCTLRVPQPPLSDHAWGGNTTGAIYLCTRPAHDGIPDPAMVVTRWLPAAPEAPDPETIAWQILAELDLESPELGVFPRGDSAQRMGFVGWNVWLWAAATSDRQWGPVSASQSEGGVSVSLTAQVTSMTWDMGNGDTVTCSKGTPWTMAATGGKNVASPTCGYVYGVDGRYTVRGTSTWSVTWSGGGQSGTIPLTLSREAEVIIGELQTVNVNR